MIHGIKKKNMDKKSVKRYRSAISQEKKIEYPKTTDLFYVGAKINENVNSKKIKDLRNKNGNSVLKYLLIVLFKPFTHLVKYRIKNIRIKFYNRQINYHMP